MSDNEGEEEAAKIVIEEESDGEEHNPDAQPKALDCELAAAGLSKLAKTADAGTFAYVNLDISGKEIETIGDALKTYDHLRDLNVSKNKI